MVGFGRRNSTGSRSCCQSATLMDEKRAFQTAVKLPYMDVARPVSHEYVHYAQVIANAAVIALTFQLDGYSDWISTENAACFYVGLMSFGTACLSPCLMCTVG